MDITPPPYIAATALPNSGPTPTWDDFVDDNVMVRQPRIEHRIAGLSYRAAVAFCLGSLEWVLHRLKPELADDVPFQFVDAAWAALVDWRYLKSLELPDWEWEYDYDRRIWGPLDKSFWLLVEAIVAARRLRPFMETPVSLSEIALRISGRPDVFKAWRRACIKRLTTYYPRDLNAPLGKPVARELLDPAWEIPPEGEEAAISTFLAQLDWKRNRYLRPPEEMLSEGFDGIPYQWRRVG
jgi:hypothetical protein